MAVSDRLPKSTLLANWKCLLICSIVSMANFEFGLDSGVVGSLQAMPGFLIVFGYQSAFIPGGYGLDVSPQVRVYPPCCTAIIS